MGSKTCTAFITMHGPIFLVCTRKGVKHKKHRARFHDPLTGFTIDVKFMFI